MNKRGSSHLPRPEVQLGGSGDKGNIIERSNLGSGPRSLGREEVNIAHAFLIQQCILSGNRPCFSPELIIVERMSYHVNGYNCNISCLGTCFSRF